MKKLLIIAPLLLGLISNLATADIITDETNLASCQSLAKDIKLTCIDNPPKTAEEVAICTTKYVSYSTLLTALNNGQPKTLSSIADPSYISPFFSITPYDLCKWEITRIAIYFYCSL